MSADILQDERVKWIRQRVVLALEIPVSIFDDYLSDNSERAKEGAQILKEYVSSKHSMGSSLMFSCKDFSDEIEGKFVITNSSFFL